MSASFACPHCGATYPIKPVLVGRAVRCTKCRNAFMLRPDGLADKVTMDAAPAPAPPTPSVPAPSPPESPVVRPAVAPQSEVRTQPGKSPSPPARDRDESSAIHRSEARTKLNRQQEEARRAMAGTLASAAAAALKAESAGKEGSHSDKREAPKSQRLVATGSGGKSSTPILVVGEGEREADLRRRFWSWTALIIVSMVLLIALASYTSPPRRALDAFTAPVPGDAGRYPRRLPHMQERAWLSNCHVLTDLGSVHLGAKHRYQLAAASPILAGIQSLPFQGEHGFWLKGDPQQVLKLWKANRSKEENLDALHEAGLETITPDEIQAKLTAAGVPAEAADLLMRFLLPTSGSPQGDATRMAHGEVPAAIEVIEFTGRNGTALQDKGTGKYSFATMDYRGILMRIDSAGWQRDWRVLSLE